MGCSEKMSNICLDPIKAPCVDYEGPLGENTTIKESCVNQHQVNEDLYAIADIIIKDQSTEQLGELCLTYPLEDGKVKLKSVLKIFEEEVCSLTSKVKSLEEKNYSELDITGFNLNFQCLIDPCGEPITNLKTLLQLLINKSCNI